MDGGERKVGHVYNPSNNAAPGRRDSHRRVSFPENDLDLVTGYMEPVDPLRLAQNVTNQEILKAYVYSCERHKTLPIQSVVEQIQNLKFNNYVCGSFDLTGEFLSYYGCESLEEIFKRVQFTYINLSDCGISEETAVALFDMFEYYESTSHLNISFNSDIGIRGWQACARYIKQSTRLEYLEAYNTKLDESEAQYLLRPLSMNQHLEVLKLEKCNLNGTIIYSLVKALSDNTTLQELYLADNGIEMTEAALLGNLLKRNTSIQVLDLSNNRIQDLGLHHIVIGLCDQKITGKGLSVCILWNNMLTSRCADHLAKLIEEHRTLEVLNIGCNSLQDDTILSIKEALIKNNTLLRLGLQLCDLSNISTKTFGDIFEKNKSLERVDLRGNKFSQEGLRYLANTLVHSNITQIDLDDVLSDDFQVKEYMEIVKNIRDKCQINKTRKSLELAKLEEVKFTSPRAISRKISLTCQTLMPVSSTWNSSAHLSEPKKVTGRLRSPDPSPIPSPVSSPIPILTKSRFSVSRVTENHSSAPLQSTKTNRFTVTIVEPPKAVSSSPNVVTVGFKCNSPTTSSSSPAITPDSLKDSTHENFIFSIPSIPCTRHSSSISLETIDSASSCNSDDSMCSTPPPTRSETNSPSLSTGLEDKINNMSLTGSSLIRVRNSSPDSAITSDEDKPMTSLEKLLSIFQAPSHLFTKHSPQDVKKETSFLKQKTNMFVKQYDNLKIFSTSNSNISKSSSTSDSISGELDVPKLSCIETMKENISPENTFTLLAAKKLTASNKPDKQIQIMNQCALENGGESALNKLKISNHSPEQLSSNFESDSGTTVQNPSDIIVIDSGESVGGLAETCVTATHSRINKINQHLDASNFARSESGSDLTNNNIWPSDGNTVKSDIKDIRETLEPKE